MSYKQIPLEESSVSLNVDHDSKLSRNDHELDDATELNELNPSEEVELVEKDIEIEEQGFHTQIFKYLIRLFLSSIKTKTYARTRADIYGNCYNILQYNVNASEIGWKSIPIFSVSFL